MASEIKGSKVMMKRFYKAETKNYKRMGAMLYIVFNFIVGASSAASLPDQKTVEDQRDRRMVQRSRT